jgi:NAD(P)-dependent dehydrogenase (short-subunit alcohol dehydrogenase family)
MTAFDAASTADEVLAGVDLSGATVLVTGTSSGLGLETARVLDAHGANVVGVVRDIEKGRRSLDEVGATGVDLYQADLASLGSVRSFTDAFVADGHDRIDVLIANAGIMACPRGETEDGFELQFGTNHLGHFVLVGRLLPQLLAASP